VSAVAALPASPRDRPREKLERAGPDALGDAELLALLIGHGTPRHDALGVAHRVLVAFGGVRGLVRLTPAELRRVAGVGPAIGGRIRAAVELGRRTLAPASDRVRIQSPAQAADFLVPLFGAYPVERFGVVLLDTGLRVTGTRLVATGSLDSVPTDPRDVFREAVASGAAAVLVFHNHPSGDPTPSAEDLRLTKRLLSAGRILGVRVIDHLILTDTEYRSVMRPRTARRTPSWRE